MMILAAKYNFSIMSILLSCFLEGGALKFPHFSAYPFFQKTAQSPVATQSPNRETGGEGHE